MNFVTEQVTVEEILEITHKITTLGTHKEIIEQPETAPKAMFKRFESRVDNEPIKI